MRDIKFAFESVQVNQKALHFVALVYQNCQSFPKKELNNLNSQFNRHLQIALKKYLKKERQQTPNNNHLLKAIV